MPHSDWIALFISFLFLALIVYLGYAHNDSDAVVMPRTGAELFVNKGCSSCHRTSCPPLTGFSSRPQIARRVPNTKDNLRKWLKDPSSIKYGTAMPNLNLTDQEVEALIGYIETL